MEEKYIDIVQKCLLILNEHFEEAENSFEKIIILSKIKELAFWLEMYKGLKCQRKH
nr:MAG TPA: hypothetical protein [Caudoviricetes sp.]